MKNENIDKLYTLAHDGDQNAEKRLFELLSARFRYFVHRKVWNEEDGQELVQEALMIISREYKELTIQTSFAAWAFKVLDNRILGLIQTKRRQSGRNVPMDAVPESSTSVKPEDTQFKRQLLSCLHKVAGSNLRYARALNLHYQGYDTEEICGKLKLSRGNFYSLLSRARDMLERCLDTGDIS